MTLKPEQKKALAEVFHKTPRRNLSVAALARIEDAVASRLKWWANEKTTQDQSEKTSRAEIAAQIKALQKALKALSGNTEKTLGQYSELTQTHKLLEATNATVWFDVFAERFLEHYDGPRFNCVAGVTMLGAACRLLLEACKLAEAGPAKAAVTLPKGRKPKTKERALVLALAVDYKDATGKKASDRVGGPFYDFVNTAYRLANPHLRNPRIPRKLMRSALSSLSKFKAELAAQADDGKYMEL